ncbi:hypothetical protein ABEB36_004149 [Hypothenemus hampei]|uniref:Coiled-coil domain-containing protein 181 n=1 Tax=Hypothenemus hampei TaxID=57062 RepID=A0ABD1F2D7_HYPHA
MRSTKVKFRDELVSFEPDLTDDDVNSIESDQVADGFPEAYLTGNFFERTVLYMYNFQEAKIENKSDNEMQFSKKNIETPKACKRKKQFKTTMKIQEVHCKEHCIEKLDAKLSISVKRLEIHEKPPLNLPPLQLHQRTCCDDIKLSNNDKNLPNYNGYRSEYGLTSRQIKDRNRHVRLMKQKELARQKLIEEYRALKVRQNEEVFCQWLREVSRRHQLSKNVKTGCRSKMGSCMSYSSNTNQKRPRTASSVVKSNMKKEDRPHTSQTCVFIEVSPKMLDKGIHIGDLLITNSKKLSKKLHILTIT